MHICTVFWSTQKSFLGKYGYPKGLDEQALVQTSPARTTICFMSRPVRVRGNRKASSDTCKSCLVLVKRNAITAFICRKQFSNLRWFNRFTMLTSIQTRYSDVKNVEQYLNARTPNLFHSYPLLKSSSYSSRIGFQVGEHWVIWHFLRWQALYCLLVVLRRYALARI